MTPTTEPGQAVVAAVRPSSIAGGQLPVLHHDQQFRLRGRLPLQGPDHNNGPVGDLLVVTASTPRVAKSSRGSRDALPLVLLGPLATSDRHPTALHCDLP
jgi:hypothetical protein